MHKTTLYCLWVHIPVRYKKGLEEIYFCVDVVNFN